MKLGTIVELGRAGEIDVDCGAGEVYVVSGERNQLPESLRRIGARVMISGTLKDPVRRTAWIAEAPPEDR